MWLEKVCPVTWSLPPRYCNFWLFQAFVPHRWICVFQGFSFSKFHNFCLVPIYDEVIFIGPLLQFVDGFSQELSSFRQERIMSSAYNHILTSSFCILWITPWVSTFKINGLIGSPSSTPFVCWISWDCVSQSWILIVFSLKIQPMNLKICLSAPDMRNQGIPQSQRRMPMHPLRRTVQYVSHYKVHKKDVETILQCRWYKLSTVHSVFNKSSKKI